MDTVKEKNSETIRIRQISSPIRCHYKQRLQLRSLGLRFVNHEVNVVDNPCTRGLIRKVAHMIRIVGE